MTTIAMLTRLKNLLRPPETKSSRTARLIAFENGGRARWTPRDYAALTREGYLGNAIVHRAVKLVAENAAACTYLLYEGAHERDQHPLLDLIARPNPRQDGAGFFEAVVAYLLLAGNAYIEAVAIAGEGGAQVRELYALRPDRMRVLPGPDGWAEFYEYTAAGRSVRFDQSASPLPPILHITAFHPLDDHYGLSPLEAAATALDPAVATAAAAKAEAEWAAALAQIGKAQVEQVGATQRAEILSSDPLQRWWRPLYALELSLLECPAFVAVMLHALWAGHEAGINGFASLSGLMMTYFGARFGVLGVYVSGRTREKLAGVGEGMPSLVAQVVKALGKKR
jgi:hypothetical protein